MLVDGQSTSPAISPDFRPWARTEPGRQDADETQAYAEKRFDREKRKRM